MSQEILDIIKEKKIISILRGVPTGKILSTIQALYDGGIRCVEITIDHSSAENILNTATAIKMATDKFDEKMQIGAGTVLTPQEVVMVMGVGAKYIISPNVSEAVIKETKQHGLLSIPGALTPSEIVAAHDWGADIIKVFPSGDLGPGYFKSLRGPLVHIPLMAVGGVNLDNMIDFLKVGAIGVGIGGNLANNHLIKDGDFAAITDLAKHFVAKIQ